MILRFWNKVDKEHGPVLNEELGPCWIWTAGRNSGGYGQFAVTHRDLRSAHRIAFELEHGVTLTSEQDICHRCDNPSCVRPSHLFQGDQRTNAADMVAKKRQARGNRHGSVLHPARRAFGERNGNTTHPEKRPRGSKHGCAKLDESRVVQVLLRIAGGQQQARIARDMGTSPQIVSLIRHRKIWKHVHIPPPPT